MLVLAETSRSVMSAGSSGDFLVGVALVMWVLCKSYPDRLSELNCALSSGWIDSARVQVSDLQSG